MRRLLAAVASLALLAVPALAGAQDGRVGLDALAKALGATGATSLEYAGNGTVHAVGQSQTPGSPWPRFNAKSFVRTIDYATGSMRDEIVRTQAENPPRGGGQQPVRGEQKQVLVVSGDHAWNMVGDTPAPAALALADRQFQLWATPHGLVKAAMAGKGSLQGRNLSVAVPGRFKADAMIGEQGLIDRVVGTIPHAVLGDLTVEITYADYKDFGGVKFPTRIKQSAGGHPSLDLTVTDVRANPGVTITTPDAIRQTTAPYSRVTSQMVADGVWYLTGGTHHSVVIEMKDHVIVVEGPLTEERAFAVIAETRSLAPSKPIRYVVATHHHFDHSGGLRAFASVNVPVITHESAKAHVERALAGPSTIAPDRLAKSGRPGRVEGVRGKRVISDGTRTVEIHHIAGNLHADDLLMVYLPKEKLLVEADVFTPLAPGATPPTPPSPYTVSFADHLAKLGLAVDQLVPIHGRMVPTTELGRTIGR
jgi:glyoxylase-like metal-dependent hydrolase (beta-lactamase superfamily II)